MGRLCGLDVLYDFGLVLVYRNDSRSRYVAGPGAERIEKGFYGVLAFGWRGSSHHWKLHQTACLLLAGIATPLVLSVHTVVSFDFTIAILPGWHSTIFPPYFVAGAIYSGFAMVLVLGLPLRKVYGLHNLITVRHLNNCGKLMLVTGLFLAYTYLIEPFTAWYSGNDLKCTPSTIALLDGREVMDKARSACDHAVASSPSLAEGHTCLGNVFRATGEYDKAVAQFREATTLDSTSDDAFRGLADAYEKLNKPSEAEATFRKAISLRPQYWGGYNWLGFFYWQQGRYDDAAGMFKEVVSLMPDNFRGYSNLGAMYVVQGRYAEAIDSLQKSLALRPTVEVYDNLGNAYFSMRRFDEAARNFEEGLKFDKTSWLSWGNLGDAYYWAPGKRPEAENAYRQAIARADEKLRVNPKDGRVLAFRATYLAMLDKREEALTSLQKALKISPKDPDVQCRAALVYNHFGDTNHLLESLGKALNAGVPAAWIRDTPDFDHLRNDPRLEGILRGH